jgi:cutinase
VIFGQACPDVMVIGARGTNEGPNDNKQDLSNYVKDKDHGVGAVIDSMYGYLTSANPKLIFSLEPAVYPTIFNLADWRNFVKNAGDYLGYAQTGAQSIAREIQDTDAACHSTVRYILAGYSLGAWAVHDALLNQLTTTQLGEVAGVALFGDPKFLPSQPIVREHYSDDYARGLATLAPGDTDIPSSLVSQTGSWCRPQDPFCQAIGVQPDTYTNELNMCAKAISTKNYDLCAHFQYTEGETNTAAAFLQPFLPPPTAPDAPGNVTATATSQYTIQVNWTEATADVQGFNIDNGCPVGSCGPGATLAQTTGPVNSVTFNVTPGAYQCFRVQAFNKAGASPWAGFACLSTPGLVLSGTQKWTNTKVKVTAGNLLGIAADGQISVSPTQAVGPGGDPSCTPAQNYPGKAFPAPTLPCFSLIARIGDGTPFEVGTSTVVTTDSGVLYLGINDNNVAGNTGSWTVKIKPGGPV